MSKNWCVFVCVCVCVCLCVCTSFSRALCFPQVFISGLLIYVCLLPLLGHVGQPLPTVEVKIVDENGNSSEVSIVFKHF